MDDRVTGVVEASPPAGRDDILATFQYTAPEYFLGENGSSRSDIIAARFWRSSRGLSPARSRPLSRTAGDSAD